MLISSVNKPGSNDKEIIGEDQTMKRLMAIADKIAPMNVPVLITGETGTGKELFTTRIHRASKRKGMFVAINCAAIPRDLFESELFGHVKGAFTGANNPQIGKFRLAHAGTLLLDEISEMPPNLQAKLLRVVEDKIIQPIGSRAPKPVDVRIIATSNKLKEKVRRGEFREDLFHRLNVINLHLPALRDRNPKDIELLAKFFFAQVQKEFGLEDANLSLNLNGYRKYGWPGNVRELENTIKRAVIMAEQGSTITIPDHSGEQFIEPDEFTMLKTQDAESASKQRLVELILAAMLNHNIDTQAEIEKVLGLKQGRLSPLLSKNEIDWIDILRKYRRTKEKVI